MTERPSLRTLLGFLMREFRGSTGRVLFFVLCLSVGVAAVVAVKAFSSAMDSGVRAKARELIAADLLISGRGLEERGLEPVWAMLESELPGLRFGSVWESMSVAASQREFVGGTSVVPGLPVGGLSAVQRSQLVALKAVSEGYPFYGDVEAEPAGALAELFGPEGANSALIAPDLSSRLDLPVGQVIVIGGSAFRIVGLLHSEPDRMGGSLAIAPRVLISDAGLERTGLRGGNNRGSYQVLAKVPDDASLGRVVERVEQALEGEFYELETFREARPELRRALSRVAAFLGLVALLSLLIGGVGISQTVRAWLATRWDQIAIYKSLGLRPREVLWLFVGQVLLLSAVGSLFGAAIGAGLPLLVPRFFGDLVPADLIDPWQPWPVVQGLILGVVVALAFSLPPLLVVLRVPAARVLRRDSQPIGRSRLANAGLAGLLLAVVFGVATLQAVGMPVAAPLVGGAFTLAVVLCVGLLMVAARLVIAAIARGRRQVPAASANLVAWRYGVSAVARPGSGTLAAVVALGLGLSVVLTMVLIERALTTRLASELPRDAPSMFLMGIREEQWAALEQILLDRDPQSSVAGDEVGGEALGTPEESGKRSVRSVPVLMTEVLLIDGQTPIERLESAEEEGNEGREWATRRQLRVTPQRDIPDGNRLIAGDWFVEDDVWEASFEREFADNLGVKVGSTVTLKVGASRGIGGIQRQLVVSSMREVDWESFSINFFVVVEEGAFPTDDVFRLATVRAAAEEEQALQDRVISIAPNVTVIRVRQALDKVLEIFERVVFGVQLLGLFTVLSGLVILTGAVAATAARRGREAALLKTLGLRRSQVALAFAVEYALVGLVAGVIGTVAAAATSYVAARWLLEVEWQFPPAPVLSALVAGVALSVLGGLVASATALRKRPIEALRAEG